MDQQRPTIYDVARQGGVAASTVSRAFGNPGRISPVTKERVYAAARELGYEPRPVARAEAPGRVRTLMLMVPDIANPYYASLIKAAQARAVRRHYTLTLADSDETPSLEATNLRQVLASTSGGILATSRLTDEIVQQLARHRPLIMLNRRIPGVPSLVWDAASGVREAVRHLTGLGHRRIAYLAGPRNSWMSASRWDAMYNEATEFGARAAFLGPFAPDGSSGDEAAHAIAIENVTAAIAYNDLLALGTLRYLRAAGTRVPQDLSLIGCDDIFGAELVSPALTTIAGPTTELGTHAVDGIVAQVQGRPRKDDPTTFEARLVVRDSTGPARAGN